MDNEKKKVVGRKSNIFVDGSYRFGLNEQKILLMVVSRVKMGGKDFVPYCVPWDEIKRMSNNELNTVKKIDNACVNLKNKTISIKSGKEVDNFGFLSGWKTYEGRHVEFRLDPGMKKMLLGLLEEGHFTLYDLEFALALPSTHAVRMYEILKSHSWKKQPVEVSLDDIKRSLDIPLNSKTYVNFSNFRQFILNRTQKNLTKYTDLTFTYKPVKNGRKVGSIEFNIKENKKFQRTVQAAIGREYVKPGDVLIINGEEYIVDEGCRCYCKNGAVPAGQLNEMLRIGTAKKKE